MEQRDWRQEMVEGYKQLERYYARRDMFDAAVPVALAVALLTLTFAKAWPW